MKREKSMNTNRFFYIIISLTFLFFFYLAFNTPLTGDDWTWGTERGLERLRSFFDGYNGRYLSNILEIILTRNDTLRYLFMAIFSTSLIYLISKLYSDKDKITYFLLSITLFLLMPVNIYSQTIGWTAGYVNYVVSLVFLLIFLVITKNIYETKLPNYSRWLWIILIPLGIMTQLVVEHVSILVVFIALYVIIYSYIKFKKFFIEHIVYFVSVIIGSIIMFTNKTYTNVIGGKDPYRTLKEAESEESNTILHKIYDAYTGNMHEYLFLDSFIVNVFIGLMAIILLFNYRTINNKVEKVIKSILLLNIIGALLFIIAVKSTLGDQYFGNKTADFESLISLLFFGSIFIVVIGFVKNSNNRMRLLLYISGVILLTAPFVFITPYGPRAAFAAYLFLILIGLELFNYNKNRLKWTSFNVNKILIYSSVILIIFYSLIFTRIGNTERERLDYLQSEIENEAKHIELTELPHSQFLWMSSPGREHFNIMFKKFYKVPEETEVEFIPYYNE